MKKLLLPFFFFIAFGTFAQKIIRTEKVTDYSTYVIGNGFEGAIFSKDYIPAHYDYIDSTKKRFSPSVRNIIQAEKSLLEDVKLKGRGKINDPFICANLDKYLRQYIGYVDPTGKKIIVINFFSKGDILEEEKDHEEFPKMIRAPQWKIKWHNVADGGNFYWRIKINLSTLQLFQFRENGFG